MAGVSFLVAWNLLENNGDFYKYSINFGRIVFLL